MLAPQGRADPQPSSGFSAASVVGDQGGRDFPGLSEATGSTSEQWPGLSKPATAASGNGGGGWGTQQAAHQTKKRGGLKTSQYEFFPPAEMKARNVELMKQMKTILGALQLFGYRPVVSCNCPVTLILAPAFSLPARHISLAMIILC